MVTPRRVTISRNIKKSGNIPLKFHRMERLHVTAIAAGMTHSTALSDDGSIFYWVSSDPNLRCQQVCMVASLVKLGILFLIHTQKVPNSKSKKSTLMLIHVPV